MGQEKINTIYWRTDCIVNEFFLHKQYDNSLTLIFVESHWNRLDITNSIPKGSCYLYFPQQRASLVVLLGDQPDLLQPLYSPDIVTDQARHVTQMWNVEWRKTKLKAQPEFYPSLDAHAVARNFITLIGSNRYKYLILNQNHITKFRNTISTFTGSHLTRVQSGLAKLSRSILILDRCQWTEISNPENWK